MSQLRRDAGLADAADAEDAYHSTGPRLVKPVGAVAVEIRREHAEVKPLRRNARRARGDVAAVGDV